MASSERRQRRAHLAGNTAGAAAAAASAPFGAAKLRDSYKESYPAKFVRGLEHLERGAQRHGMDQQRGARLVRVASRGKPGFAPLVTATVAASTAGAARRYERHLDHKAVRKSAFGIEVPVAKTDTGRGYRPASSMTATQHRAAQRQRIVARETNVEGAATGGGLSRVYAGHGVEPGIAAAVKDSTRRSKVHPKVHYGSSITPEFEQHLDRSIHPAHAARLRHPVVLHRGKTMPGALAAAAGAHTTTGGRGHVIFNNQVFDASGTPGSAYRSNGTFRSMVHHELAHAGRHGQNPARPRSSVSHLGEEARADAVGVPGAGIYRRNKLVPSRPAARAWAALNAKAEAGGMGVEALSGPHRYHQVHRQVRSALGQPPGLLTETAHSVATRRLRPTPRKLVLAAAATGAGGLHHHKKQAMSKAEPGRRAELAGGAGSALAARGAVRSRRVGRAHLLRAADLERDSNAAFSAARSQGSVVTQRLVRHTTTGPGSLPRTSGNLANTGRAHLKQQGHLHAGLAARDASHAATAAGRKAMGRSKGKLALAAGLGGVAAASTSRQRY